MALVLAYLDQRIEVPESESAPETKRLDEVTVKIAELMTAYRAGEISGSLVFPSIQELEAEQKMLQSQVTRQVRKAKQVTSAAQVADAAAQPEAGDSRGALRRDSYRTGRWFT